MFLIQHVQQQKVTTEKLGSLLSFSGKNRFTVLSLLFSVQKLLLLYEQCCVLCWLHLHQAAAAAAAAAISAAQHASET